MAYEAEMITYSQKIFYYLLCHGALSDLDAGVNDLYRAYVEHEEVMNLVKNQAEIADCKIERYGTTIYLMQNIVSERLKAGLALEQEREQDGTNLYTEMYETVLDYKSMSEAYEALKSVEAGSRSKYTKEGYVSIICSFLDRQGLIIFIPEDEMIKTTAKLDNIMEYKILNKENYARIMETLGETHE